MSIDVATFADAVIVAADQSDGHALAQLFAVDSIVAANLGPNLHHLPSVRVVPALRKCKGYLKDPWEACCAARIQLLQHLLFARVEGRLENHTFLSRLQDTSTVDVPACVHHLKLAFEQQLQLVNAFLRWFGSLSPGAWALPLLLQILRDLCTLAKRLDNAENTLTVMSQANGTASTSTAIRTAIANATFSHKRLEEAARQLNKGFTACVADRNSAPEESKRLGTYAIVNLIFKTYFRLKSTPLCKNILRALSAAGIPSLETFSIADQVSFRFYTGVLAFLDEEYEKASEYLSFAFLHCHARAVKNQELILQYLIPLRMLHGSLPSMTFLQAFPRLLALYGVFVAAFRKGDVRSYDQAVANSTFEKALIGKGVYLAMERAREGCLRTLFRRVWLAKDRSTRLSLDMLHRALVWTGMQLDVEEAEWYVATLIHKGYMKGYISHERQMVVLSAKDAFPPLSAVVAINE